MKLNQCFHNNLLLEVDAALFLCSYFLLLLLMVASNKPVDECYATSLPEFKLGNCASSLNFNGSQLQVSFPYKQNA